MATGRFTAPVFIASGTDSWFRGFSTLSDFLTTAGFPKTSDTGQVDWVTVTIPASNATTAYEIRRFNDTEQSTDPIYFRIDYMRTTSTNDYPRIRLTFGTGSNGSGTITGAVTSVLYTITLSNVATARDYVASSDGSGFACLAGVGGASIARCFFSFERARDKDGSTVAGQVMLIHSGSSIVTSPPLNSPIAVIYDLAMGTMVISNTIPAYYWQSLSAATISLNQGSYYPFGVCTFPTRYGVLRSKMMIGAAWADFTDQAILDVPRFSGETVYQYLYEKKEANTLAGSFGPSPTGVATTVDDSPSAFAMPCILWVP